MKPKRTLVLADCHGNLKALRQVFERCNYDVSSDKLIFLGDAVDRFPESAGVVQFFIDLKEESVHDPVFIRGNHDRWCEEWLFYGQSPNIWVQQGGKETMESYINSGLLTEDSHKAWFKDQVNYYIDDEGRAFVHGGFTSSKGLGHEPYVANYYWDRDLWTVACVRHNNDTPEYKGPIEKRRMYKHKEIYIGHTTVMNLYKKPSGKFRYAKSTKEAITEPIQACNVWNLDTGGGFAGKLTIMDIDTKEFWQSDNVEELYS